MLYFHLTITNNFMLIFLIISCSAAFLLWIKKYIWTTEHLKSFGFSPSHTFKKQYTFSNLINLNIWFGTTLNKLFILCQIRHQILNVHVFLFTNAENCTRSTILMNTEKCFLFFSNHSRINKMCYKLLKISWRFLYQNWSGKLALSSNTCGKI